MDAPAVALAGLAVSRRSAPILEAGVRLGRRLRAAVGEPRDPAEQGLEDVARPRGGPAPALGIVAGDEIADSAAGARLQSGEIGLHARDLGVDLAALWRRIRAENQELAILAAKRARIGARARELGALTIDGGPGAARPAGGDRLLQTGAFGVLRQGAFAAESDERGRKGRQNGGRRQNSAKSERGSHASRLHPVNRLRAPRDSQRPRRRLSRAGGTGLETGIAARTRRRVKSARSGSIRGFAAQRHRGRNRPAPLIGARAPLRT